VDAAAVVKLLGGIGMFLLGIHHLTEGLKGLSGDSLRRVLQKLVSGRFSAVVSGALLTVATQSPAIFKAPEEASKQLSAERKAGREKLLADVALQRAPAATARAGLDPLAWANGAVYHAWRLAESLRIASGK